MPDSKRYYWLKLKRDFFKRHDIQIIEAMQNGKDYVLFYLKLLVESVDHDGSLRFSNTIPYNEQMLATITNTNIDTVRTAMKILQELQLVEVLDDQTIYMEETEKMVGSECWSAERVRRFRNNEQKALQSNIDETGCNAPVTKSKSKRKSKSTDKENIEKTPVSPAADSFLEQVRNSFIANCPSLPKPNASENWTPARKKAVHDKKLSAEEFGEAFKRIEKSDFLTGRSGNWHGCSLDWILKPANWQKINEGNYDNRGGDGQKRGHSPTFNLDEYERTSSLGQDIAEFEKTGIFDMYDRNE